MSGAAAGPLNLVAELTHRCPLRCAYCSNPLELIAARDELASADWQRVFAEAAELGAVHVGLTGGEPSARADLEELVASAAQAGLYTHLVSAGFAPERLAGLVRAGLRSVQLSVQDSRRETNDRVAGAECFDAKLRFARAVREAGLPLALNFVLHRHNLDHLRELIALGRELGAERIELAHAQYYGWARRNRAGLLPTLEQVREARRIANQERVLPGAPELLHVTPDFFSDRPKACMGGWGRRILVVDPKGLVLPCHAAAELPGLEFFSVREHPLAEAWRDAPGMQSYRGEGWMQEPCRSCPERARDFGGCRCQAFALTGDAAATDPACALSPQHARIRALREEAPRPLIPRERRGVQGSSSAIAKK